MPSNRPVVTAHRRRPVSVTAGCLPSASDMSRFYPGARRRRCASNRSIAGIVSSCVTGFLLWCVLLVVCCRLELMALIADAIVWVLLLPFRILGIAVDGALGLLRAIVMLPARIVR